MVIKDSRALTLAELSEIVGEREKAKKIKEFIKKLHIKHLKKSEKIKGDIEALNLLKLKNEHIVKIADFMPEDSADLSKILQGVSLDQDEVNKILEVLK